MEGHLSHVHQCPRCELRYRNEHELRAHLAEDHDDSARELAEDLEASRTIRAHLHARTEHERTHIPGT